VTSAPTALAVFRALATIPIVWAIAADLRLIAVGLFVVAAATDALDGWIARRAGTTGPLGAFLDPLADKILVVGSLVALAAVGRGWPVSAVAVLVTLRELTAAVLRARALRLGIALHADTLAKAKTVAQMAGVALIIVGERPWAVLGATVLGVALLIGVVTLPGYFSPRPADR
jgi:CDP-diacylglycerol--glycerol-3-phosphate 3-phosphatidyltransferase